MKLSNILYALSTFSTFTLTSGNFPDKTNNEFFALIIDYNYLLTEINFLSQLEDNQFKGLSHLDSITSTCKPNQCKFKLLCSLNKSTSQSHGMENQKGLCNLIICLCTEACSMLWSGRKATKKEKKKSFLRYWFDYIRISQKSKHMPWTMVNFGMIQWPGFQLWPTIG